MIRHSNKKNVKVIFFFSSEKNEKNFLILYWNDISQPRFGKIHQNDYINDHLCNFA